MAFYFSIRIVIMRKYLCLLLALLACQSFAKNVISDYQRIFLPVYTTKGDLMLAIRVLKINATPSFLVVNPDSLETKLLPITALQTRNARQKKKAGYFTQWGVASTRYYQLLNKNTAPPYLEVNQGITHADTIENGNVLTIDLCPSSKPFEKEFFNKLARLSETNKKPTPITIAISGMWLIEHSDEFQWLLKQEKEKKLAITWANHSFSHTYYSDLPYSENFLLTSTTNIETEVLLTEKYLLEEGELPSVFFRFPGLISNKKLIKQIKQYGLIPLGTDAWMANLEKNHQTITPGGIILVHGNSNEHKGILSILPLLTKLNFVNIKEAI
jgi:peptidoglycan/xylan/chitin deacetylase (PgdA/CDA1 family)